MAAVAFPTCPPPGHKTGYPAEAESCACGDKRLLYDGECLWCGRLPGHVIRATWARQAAEMVTVAA